MATFKGLSGGNIVSLPKEDPIRFTVDATTSVSKGTLMQLTTPRTASIASARGQAFAGIAAADKASDDGATTLALWTPGSGAIYDLTYDNSGGGGVGELCVCSGNNLIAVAGEVGDISGGLIVGKMLENTSTNAVIQVQL